ncbi:MAG: Gfo/Idh/MocA family oxidoreductase [Bacteroidota bacterium]
MSFAQHSTAETPLKVAVIGLTHTHVHWILGRPNRGDIKIVAIVEPNKDLAERYAVQHGYSMDLVYASMDEMLEKVKPEAVTAFGTIYEHLEVVETFAPLGIHVMVEKPLAISMDHAKKMQSLAKKHNIHLLTNYETTWYHSNHKAYAMVDSGLIGPLRKMVIHDGHQGPEEIGINKEFLEWLIDPAQNGAGALTDFGCYGANLLTWFNKGERPSSVMAMAHTYKPEKYPLVDDDATILVEYPSMQGVIQASWNWPVSRKDMEVYGKTGYIMSDNRSDLRYRLSEKEKEYAVKLPEREAPLDDPFALLEAVIRGKLTLPPYALSSLENNMIVVEILEAAMKSAKKGKRIYLK